MNSNRYDRKKKVKYVFTSNTNTNDIYAVPEEVKKKQYNYYQIASYRHPRNDMHHLRKFSINYNNEFTDVAEYMITKKQCKQFLSNHKPNEYKFYAVYDLDNIDYPNLGEVSMSKSSILENDYNYTGYAPF